VKKRRKKEKEKMGKNGKKKDGSKAEATRVLKDRTGGKEKEHYSSVCGGHETDSPNNE